MRFILNGNKVHLAFNFCSFSLLVARKAHLLMAYCTFFSFAKIVAWRSGDCLIHMNDVAVALLLGCECMHVRARIILL